MVECIDYKKIKEYLNSDGQFITFVSFEQFKDVTYSLNLDKYHNLTSDVAQRYESHELFDYISFNLINKKELFKKKQHICIYLFSNVIILIGDFSNIMHNLKIKESSNVSEVLFYIIDGLIFNDVEFLDEFEEKIENLEDLVVTEKKSDCIKEIMSIRKQLMILRKYYHQLNDIANQIVENNNGIINGKMIRNFRIYTQKVDRLYSTVVNLRDYVTQVREAYQAQVDIQLNKTMKVFTVITAIFMPLTLIAGWYGMNLKMPEYNLTYGYPIIICASIIFITTLVYYFKKHNWF